MGHVPTTNAAATAAATAVPTPHAADPPASPAAMAPHERAHSHSPRDDDDDDTVVIPVVGDAVDMPPSGYDKLHSPPNATGSTHRLPPPPPSNAASANGNGSGDNQETTEDLMHGINSFWAIVFPVCITMIIASVVVVNYRNSSIEASMQTYLVFGQAEQKSGAEQVGLSLVNALVIIGAIALLTFGMALLYKFNCIKFLTGYIMFASTAILSFVGGQLVDSVINDQLKWAVDWPSFLFVMINFGVVGVVSIFYQKGTPKFIQNGYLVMVSVILAWEFSMWPEWTTFIFCVMFACYDLCAVLTPCGPLKCLIKLIQDKQAPLPGLIYEADVRDGVSNEQTRANQTAAAAATAGAPVAKNTTRTSSSGTATSSNQSNSHGPRPPRHTSSSHSEAIEAALADPNRPRNVAESDFTTHECETMEELIALLERFYQTFSPHDVWKAPQVAEKFFATQERLWLLIFHKYTVCSCSINMACPVQVRQEERRRRQEEEDEDDKTIKLGLGDFIFYSVLVGRSAIYDFSTFVTAFICIVMGLGGTLFLLAVLHKALPALPISIFLATFFYFWTRYLFVDFCDFLMMVPAAV